MAASKAEHKMCRFKDIDGPNLTRQVSGRLQSYYSYKPHHTCMSSNRLIEGGSPLFSVQLILVLGGFYQLDFYIAFFKPYVLE